jgi:peptidyl-prolyl cis-trans isomerase A (cyclophilin A)
MNHQHLTIVAPALGLVALCALGCKAAPPEPEPKPRAEPVPEQSADSAAEAQREARERLRELVSKRQQEKLGSGLPERHVASAKLDGKESAGASDPLEGKFTLADATRGLPAKGKLVAEIKMAQGTLQCELYEDKAPVTVANFVGLARGLRPFKDPRTSEWVKRPAYDGTVFHRIIKGFMIQGGDPTGTGAGEPGYVIADEIWEGGKHDQRGLICMANRGPNTNGMQFFIMDGSKPHLDGGYTIFGKCGPDAVIEKLAASETVGDKAVTPPVMEHISVKRVPGK